MLRWREAQHFLHETPHLRGGMPLPLTFFACRKYRSFDVCFAIYAFHRVSRTTGVCDVWRLLCFASTLLESVLQVGGVVVGCEAPHLRSILRMSLVDLVPRDHSMNLI